MRYICKALENKYNKAKWIMWTFFKMRSPLSVSIDK